MRILLSLFSILILFGCSSNKTVYWCGDHQCLNKKEKEAYFKKTMIVEVREVKKIESNEKSEIEAIKELAKCPNPQSIQLELNINAAKS